MESETDNTVVIKHETDPHDQHVPDEMQPRWRRSGTIDRKHPLGGEMSDIVRGLFRHARLPWLTQNYARTPILALFSFINGCLSIGLMAALALLTRSPFVFAAQYPGGPHDRCAGRLHQPARHRPDGGWLGAGGRRHLTSCDRCRALAGVDGGPDGPVQVPTSSHRSNHADHFPWHPDKTLAVGAAARSGGCPDPPSVCH